MKPLEKEDESAQGGGDAEQMCKSERNEEASADLAALESSATAQLRKPSSSRHVPGRSSVSSPAAVAAAAAALSSHLSPIFVVYTHAPAAPKRGPVEQEGSTPWEQRKARISAIFAPRSSQTRESVRGLVSRNSGLGPRRVNPATGEGEDLEAGTPTRRGAPSTPRGEQPFARDENGDRASHPPPAGSRKRQGAPGSLRQLSESLNGGVPASADSKPADTDGVRKRSGALLSSGTQAPPPGAPPLGANGASPVLIAQGERSGRVTELSWRDGLEMAEERLRIPTALASPRHHAQQHSEQYSQQHSQHQNKVCSIRGRTISQLDHPAPRGAASASPPYFKRAEKLSALLHLDVGFLEPSPLEASLLGLASHAGAGGGNINPAALSNRRRSGSFFISNRVGPTDDDMMGETAGSISRPTRIGRSSFPTTEHLRATKEDLLRCKADAKEAMRSALVTSAAERTLEWLMSVRCEKAEHARSEEVLARVFLDYLLVAIICTTFFAWVRYPFELLRRLRGRGLLSVEREFSCIPLRVAVHQFPFARALRRRPCATSSSRSSRALRSTPARTWTHWGPSRAGGDPC